MIEGPEIAAFEVFPENWDALNVFLACSTQWRYRAIPNGSMQTGLEYTSVRAAIQMHRAKMDVFAQVQVMEFAALKILTSR